MIFVALSAKVTAGILSVDERIFIDLFTTSRSMTTPSPLYSGTPLASQTIAFATAVHLNSASVLTEVLIDRGGIFIPLGR